MELTIAGPKFQILKEQRVVLEGESVEDVKMGL
jgi:hypothetical protein